MASTNLPRSGEKVNAGGAPRPLVDLITNEWRSNDTTQAKKQQDNDDTEDPYPYSLSHEGKPLRMPPWLLEKLQPTQISSHFQSSHLIPRRIPPRLIRAIKLWTSIALASVMAYLLIIRPTWMEYDSLRRSLAGNDAKGVFGNNIMPAFHDIIPVKHLNSSLVPGSAHPRRRLITVGDVHGHRDELSALLEKVTFDRTTDHLIFTGDIISKGPSSAETVDLAQKFGASCVRGNHEDRILLAHKSLFLSTLPPPEEGGVDRAKYKVYHDFLEEAAVSHGSVDEREMARSLGAKRIAWLKECPVVLDVGYIEGMGKVAVVHAGLAPKVSLEDQDPFLAMNMRTVDLETRAPSEASKGTPWYKLWNFHQSHTTSQDRITTIYGHDSKRGLQIHQYSKGIDTGCVSGGRLTAFVIELDESGNVVNSIVDVPC